MQKKNFWNVIFVNLIFILLTYLVTYILFLFIYLGDKCSRMQIWRTWHYLYITKSWSVVFNVAALTLHHISCYVILFFFFSFLKYNLSYNFKMIFTIFSPINAAHYLFIYSHYHPIINPAHYLFIYFYYHPIINLYN